MEKIKGQIYMFNPNTKNIEEMEIEARVEVDWREVWAGENERIFRAFPYAVAKCPYDQERLSFDIIFSDDTGDDYPTDTTCAGRCIHFAPSDYLSDREIDRMTSEIHTIEEGIMYVEETKKEFAEKMGWEVQWWGSLGNEYYVFVEKPEE